MNKNSLGINVGNIHEKCIKKILGKPVGIDFDLFLDKISIYNVVTYSSLLVWNVVSQPSIRSWGKKEP